MRKARICGPFSFQGDSRYAVFTVILATPMTSPA